MTQSLHVTDLYESLKHKQQQDRRKIEELTKTELDALAQNLKKQSSDALNTTVSAIESELNRELSRVKKQIDAQTKPLSASLASLKTEAEKLQMLTFRSWVKAAAISLSLLLGIFAGSWGLMQWLSRSITSQLETRAALAQQIEQAKQTLAQIEAKTWGVEFVENSSGRFLILPPGIEPVTGWKVGNRHAVRLGKN